MLTDFNNVLAVFVVIGMAWFLGWMLLDDRKGKKTGSHEYFLQDEWREWE